MYVPYFATLPQEAVKNCLQLTPGKSGRPNSINVIIYIKNPFNDREWKMLQNFTAKYTKIDSGYMGQLIEWPEVVTEGKDIESCRKMLRDALDEMILAYKEQGREIPLGGALIEQVPVETNDVRQTA